MLIQRNKCCCTPVGYDWLGETGGDGPRDIHFVMRECSFGQSSDSLVTDCLPATPWAPGISTCPFTAKETRQAVKNNYTVKSWKGKGGGGDLVVEVNRLQGTKQWLERPRASSYEARSTLSNKKCFTWPHHKWSLGWPRGQLGQLPPSVILITVRITPMFAILAWDAGRSLSCPLALHTGCRQQIKLSVHRHAAGEIKKWFFKKWDLLAFYSRE